MDTLDKLLTNDKKHWELHLKAAQADLPVAKTAISEYLASKIVLPELKHPSYIHDWLEHPELRKDIEAQK